MTQFGLDLYDWLSRKDWVTELRDESTRKYGDAISCTYGGKHHFITIDHDDCSGLLQDPREVLDEVNKEDWQ